MSPNCDLACLPVRSSYAAFYDNVNIKWIDGLTLWIDHPNPTYIDHMGYWIEMSAAIYSKIDRALKRLEEKLDGELFMFKHVLMVNLQRKEVLKYPWILDLLSLALVPVKQHLASYQPKMWFYGDLSKEMGWIGLEKVLYIAIKDRNRDQEVESEDETGVFGSAELAQSFRQEAWRVTGVETAEPRDITLIIPIDGGGFSNPKDMLAALHDAIADDTMGKLAVRPYSPTAHVSLKSLVMRVSRSRILIGRHGWMLSMALFLPPGSSVIELLQYNSDGLETYNMQSQIARSVGDITHLSWKPVNSSYVSYMAIEDERYASWLPGECFGEDCVAVHENSPLRVDAAKLHEMVKACNQFSGNSGRNRSLEQRYPFPFRAEMIEADTGVWWD